MAGTSPAMTSYTARARLQSAVTIWAAFTANNAVADHAPAR
jgi:hypothetical protein